MQPPQQRYCPSLRLQNNAASLSPELLVQWNLCIVVTLGPTFCGCIIEGGCIIEVHNTLAMCTLGPNKVALIERWLLYRVTTL